MDRDEIKAKNPGLAKIAVTSRAAAVRLFCIECMGGNRRHARGCSETGCFLWPHWRARVNASAQTPPEGHVSDPRTADGSAGNGEGAGSPLQGQEGAGNAVFGHVAKGAVNG